MPIIWKGGDCISALILTLTFVTKRAIPGLDMEARHKSSPGRRD